MFLFENQLTCECGLNWPLHSSQTNNILDINMLREILFNEFDKYVSVFLTWINYLSSFISFNQMNFRHSSMCKSITLTNSSQSSEVCSCHLHFSPQHNDNGYVKVSSSLCSFQDIIVW